MAKERAFKKLYDLGDDRMAEIDRLLQAGVYTSQIVRTIQEDWGELTEDKPDSLKRTLERYRASDFRNKVVAAVAGFKGNTSAMVKRVNAMDELQSLVMVQKGRFEKALTQEAKAPLPMKMVSDEARLLKDLLIELGHMQMETGVMPRAAKKTTGVITDENGVARQFSWTEEQEQLFREVADLDMEAGDYEVIAEN